MQAKLISNVKCALLLLGIVVYSGLPFSNIPFDQHWPVKAPDSNPVFDLLFIITNYFRMPLLILVGGIAYGFTVRGLAVKRSTISSYVKVLVPAFLLVMPLVVIGFALFEVDNIRSIDGLYRQIVGRQYPFTLHIWYLYYLLIYTLIFSALSHGWHNIRRALPTLSQPITSLSQHILYLLCPTLVFIFSFETAALNAATSIVPNIKVLLGHLPFFCLGLSLAHNQTPLKHYQQYRYYLLLVALLFLLVNLTVNYLKMVNPETYATVIIHFVAAISYNMVMWCSVLGLLGLFSMRAHAKTTVNNNKEDLLLFSYVVHLPIVIFTTYALKGLQLGAVLQFAITLLAVCLCCGILYGCRILAAVNVPRRAVLPMCFGCCYTAARLRFRR